MNFRVRGPLILDQLHRVGRRTARGQHGVTNERHALADVRQVQVVLLGQQRIFVPLEAHKAHPGRPLQRQQAIEKTVARRARSRRRSSGWGSRTGALKVVRGVSTGRLDMGQSRSASYPSMKADLVHERAKARHVGRDVAQLAEFVGYQRMVNNGESIGHRETPHLSVSARRLRPLQRQQPASSARRALSSSMKPACRALRVMV